MNDIERRNRNATEDTLERGRASYERRAWNEAFEALSQADAAALLGTDDLERLAWSAALTGRDEEFLRAQERLYQICVDAGECRRAARSAFWIGLRLLSLGEPGRASGWLARAQRLLEQEERECAEQGYLLLPIIHRNIAVGEYDAAHEAAAKAAAIGDSFGEPDLTTFARILQGRALMRMGRIRAGVRLLDEAMVAATGDECSPLMTGMIYCTAIATCQQVFAFDRAREWTLALAGWCEAQPQLVSFTGSCLVHRSEIMQLGGAWPEAMEEARRASARFAAAVNPEAVADAYYQEAEIHRLRGEVEAAEVAYRRANEFGREPQPGLALLRLAQGRVDAAAGAMRRILAATSDPLQRTRFLPAHVEIMLAAGDLEEAKSAAGELEELAERFDVDLLGAIAAHARGSVRLAEGDARAAIEPLRRAFQAWQQVGSPYLAARIRVLLGRAYRALGDEDGASLELEAARQTFERLEATPDLVALSSSCGDAPKPSAKSPAAGAGHRLTPRELEVLRLVASGKTNKDIARELCVSEKTIDRHVSNMFMKMDVSSRAAATAFAYEHGLI